MASAFGGAHGPAGTDQLGNGLRAGLVDGTAGTEEANASGSGCADVCAEDCNELS